jgi:hypothetical protein
MQSAIRKRHAQVLRLTSSELSYAGSSAVDASIGKAVLAQPAGHAYNRNRLDDSLPNLESGNF